MDIVSSVNNKLTVFAGCVLSGKDFTPLNNGIVTIEDDLITSVEPASSEVVEYIKSQIVSGYKLDDNLYCFPEDHTLMPALIDAHVHIGLGRRPPEGGSFASDSKDSNEMLSPQLYSDHKLKGELRSFLENGIFAVRDGGDASSFNLAVSKALKTGLICGPLMVPTGEALRRLKGYGSFLGRGFRGLKDLPYLIDFLADVGVGQLKVIVSGIVSFREYGKVKPSPLTDEELTFIVEAARRKGLKVMAHASSSEAVDKAIAANVDSVEHGYFIEDESLKKMAEKQIFWIPTIIPVATQAKSPLDFNKTPLEIDVIKQTYERQMDKLCLAVKEGVPVGVGTDSGASGVRHGVDYHRELLLYKDAGLSVKRILQAAITENASLLNIASVTIDEGSYPAIIAVKGSPFRDISVLKKPVAIFQKNLNNLKNQ